MTDFSAETLTQTLANTGAPAPGRIWVGFSGGLDSTVLLHALVAQRNVLAAPLHAVHVNHGLHGDANAWAAHCAQVCSELDVPIETFGVIVDAASGASVEAAARDARYDVFRELLQPNDWLLTAQHQDDQLETFLLQALRGAGPHGLAAMPRSTRLGAGWLLRPLLDWPRLALESWARLENLRWIDDPSNADERFDRNYLRREIVPRMKARWPGAGATVTRSAAHCAETAVLVDELAALDLEKCGKGSTLDIAALRLLDAPRCRNVLRHWLDWQGIPRPSEKKLRHILHDVLDAAPDAEPCVAWGSAAVRRYRGRLYIERASSPPRRGEWRGEEFELGEGWGTLRRQEARLGLPPKGRVDVRYRRGGEILRPEGRAHHHELRKLFQEAGALPWQRKVLPLVYIDDQFAAVGDIWLNADLLQEGGWRIQWENRPEMFAEEQD